MRSTTLALLLATAALLAAPTATAHVTVTATAPKDPMPPGATTSIPVTLSANCAVVLAEYDSAGNTELTLGVLGGGPSWLGSTGDKIPFKFDMCSASDATVRSTGKVHLTPGPLAPALSEVTLALGAKGESGQANVPVKVGYRAAVQLSTDAFEVMVDNGTAVALLVLNATINADSMAMVQVSVPPELGTIEDLPGAIDLASPLAENRTWVEVPIEFRYVAKPGVNLSMEMVTISVFVHAVQDAAMASEPAELMFHFMAHEGHGEDHQGHEHDHDVHGLLPGPELGVLALVLAGLAATLRRRRSD